jgi:F0F1-type ATP synthase membrane subunit b/b'
MDPYARPNERKVGEARPKISHTGSAADVRTRQDRKKEKEEIKSERRAIKKAARQHLKRQLLDDLKQNQ